jgi:hypothetical protein
MKGMIVAVLLLLVSAGPVSAKKIMGLGNGSCGSWIEARRTNAPTITEADLLEQWVVGYLTGANVMASMDTPDLFTKTDFDGLMG